MVYYLSEVEYKLLLKDIRPVSRKVGVTDELRGWNWDRSPLKPYHEVFLPMYLICSSYCPTSRDVYLNKVKKEQGQLNHPLSLGRVLHDTVSEAYSRAKQLDFDAQFKNWYKSQNYEQRLIGNFTLINRYAMKTWNYIMYNAKSRLQSTLSTQPYGKEEDLLSTAVPFLCEHKISGKLLGTSSILSLDCYDYMRSIIFDLKTGVKNRKEEDRLFPTGYALVFESVYEVPVDVGCTVYLKFKDNRMVIERDLFHITDDLRSRWIEDRDKKSEIVYEKLDPGRPSKCPSSCIYREVCGD